jgi:DNA-binding transcriptional MerR regulator
MASKARVQKRLYYKIGEACKALGIQPYVLRYWETEFPALTPSKSRSGQRVYSEKELGIIRRIKELLYEEGYTIAGAKKKLETELASGALEGPEEDDDTEREEPAPAAKAAKTARAPRTAPAPQPEPAGESAPTLFPDPEPAVPEAPPALDTEGGERVQRLLSGIGEALQEARDLLAFLPPKSS